MHCVEFLQRNNQFATRYPIYKHRFGEIGLELAKGLSWRSQREHKARGERSEPQVRTTNEASQPAEWASE